jgi:hypothetical protein
MKCEHCGYEAPERAVICPECGEILPKPEKQEETATKAATVPDTFATPFLAAPGGGKTDGIATEDPTLQEIAAKEKKHTRNRRIVAICIAVVLILGIVLYQLFLGGYKKAVFCYVKGVDYSSGSMYVSLVPDAFMDYLETTYETTRREVKTNLGNYFVSWNENYGTEGRMSYEIRSTNKVTDESKLAELEDELNTDYGIVVTIKKAVDVKITIDDGGTKATEVATFVKIGTQWCCMEAMEDIDYVCEYSGYGAW